MRQLIKQFSQNIEEIFQDHNLIVESDMEDNFYLLHLLKRQVEELEETLINGKTELIKNKTADVALFAIS